MELIEWCDTKALHTIRIALFLYRDLGYCSEERERNTVRPSMRRLSVCGNIDILNPLKLQVSR